MKLIEEIKELLGDEIYKSGAAFYSSVTTLKKGRFLILGLNPGGNPEEIKTSIADSLQSFMDPNYNQYYVSWREDDIEHRLQKNLKELFASFGEQLREVCALNLIFERTGRESQLRLSSLPKYRDILLKIVGTVQPEVIVTFGKKPLSEIKSVIAISEVQNVPSGHGKWQIEMVTGLLRGSPIKVIGFPHLSIYTIYNRPEQLKIVRSFAVCTQQ